MKKFSGKLSVGGRTNLAFSAQLGVKNLKDSLTYAPQLEIIIPQKNLKYKGIIDIHPGKSFLVDMNAKGFTDDTINLKGKRGKELQNGQFRFLYFILDF